MVLVPLATIHPLRQTFDMLMYLPNLLIGDVSQPYAFASLVSDIQLSRSSFAADEGNYITSDCFPSLLTIIPLFDLQMQPDRTDWVSLQIDMRQRTMPFYQPLVVRVSKYKPHYCVEFYCQISSDGAIADVVLRRRPEWTTLISQQR